MKPRQRTIHFYDLILKSHTKSRISNPSCCSITDILSKLKPKGREVINNRNISLEVTDWLHDKKHNIFYCLLNRADANVSDVAFKDFGTKNRRNGGKTKSEGIEYSCHVIFKPDHDPRKALMLMTMGSGVTYGAIEKFLREFTQELQVLNQHPNLFKFPHPSGAVDENGNPETYKVSYAFSAEGHMGTLLDDALETGTFHDMELVADQHAQFDSGGNLQVDHQSLHVVAANAKTVTGAFLKNALTRWKKTPQGSAYRTARIKFKTVDGTTKSNSFDINNLDAAFTRRENVELANEVDGQQVRLNKTILDAMLKLI